MVREALSKRLTIDVFHQDAIVIQRNIADEVRMLQTIARLKLFAKGFLVSDVVGILWFQPFQEVQFAIEFDAEGVAGGSLCIQWFLRLKGRLAVRKLR